MLLSTLVVIAMLIITIATTLDEEGLLEYVVNQLDWIYDSTAMHEKISLYRSADDDPVVEVISPS